MVNRTIVLVVGHIVELVEECHPVVHMVVAEHRMEELVLAPLAVRMVVPIHKVALVDILIVLAVHKELVVDFPFDSLHQHHHIHSSTVRQLAQPLQLHLHIRLIHHHHTRLPQQPLSP